MKTISRHPIDLLPILIIPMLMLICMSWIYPGPAAAQAPAAVPNPSSTLPPVSQDGSEDPNGTAPDGAAQMTDIHDIKPLQILGTDPRLFLYALIAAGVLALCIILFLIWRKRRKQQTEEDAIPRPPEEIALAALGDLADMTLEDGRIFYFRLSAILRRYIEARYRIHALEMTSEEFLPVIEKLGSDRKIQQDLRELIRSTDPVKFAGQPALNTKMQDDMAFARDYIDRTTPVQDLAENV
jgi:hypothetical protein